ncbi:MAG: hypothetical protein JST65_21300 [Acidobacteria bacterium]|nr:hypothetical protein [Acidobacteriota bacterium]
MGGHQFDRGDDRLTRYSARLAEAGAQPSADSVGGSCDNALAETIIGLLETEVIHQRGPLRTVDDVKYATLAWVDRFNLRRILQPIGDISLAELGHSSYQQQQESAKAA